MNDDNKGSKKVFFSFDRKNKDPKREEKNRETVVLNDGKIAYVWPTMKKPRTDILIVLGSIVI